jgi:hypothetical protein
MHPRESRDPGRAMHRHHQSLPVPLTKVSIHVRAADPAGWPRGTAGPQSEQRIV